MAGTEKDSAGQGNMIAGMLIKHFIDNAATCTAAILSLLTPEQIADACRQVYEQMPIEKLVSFQVLLRRLELPIYEILERRENEE